MRVTIKAKLAGAFGVVLLVTAGTGVANWSKLSLIQTSVEQTEQSHIAVGTIRQALAGLLEQESGLRGYLASADQHHLDLYKAGGETYAKALAEARKLLEHDPAQRARLDEMDRIVQSWRAEIAEREIGLMAQEATREEARRLIASGADRAAMESLHAKAAEIERAEIDLLHHQEAIQAEAFAGSYRTALVGGLLALILGVAFAVAIALGIGRGLGRVLAAARAVALGDLSQPATVKSRDEIGDLGQAVNEMIANLRETATVAGRIAEGDLSVEAPRRSEDDVLGTALGKMIASLQGTAKLAERIAGGDLMVEAEIRSERDMLGKALQTMLAKLQEIVGNVTAAVENVAAGAEQSSATAETLSQGSTEQASAAEQASSAMEEMAANIRQNADNAGQTQKIASLAAENAGKSGEAVTGSVAAMRTIAEKIKIVQEIARQTDLLALNAAIEAARAGQHGKGFAVVASEVRKLAERSQHAAAEIGELSTGTLQAAEEAGRMLQALVPEIRKTAELVVEISTACREQNVGAEQINQAIQQLDQVIQQNATASNEMAATAEELSAQALQLRQQIAYFRLGEAAAAARPVALGAPVVSERPASRPAKVAKPAAKPAKTKANGFTLSLEGAEVEDHQFERISA
jgi:methyl-accepting chemotaxis protein